MGNTVKKELRLTTTTFEEGWSSITKYCLAVNELFEHIPKEEQTEECIKKEMAKLIVDHIPNQVDRTNVFWNFTVQYNRVFLKTDKKIAFGWTVKYNQEENEYKPEEYNFTILLFNPERYMEKLLINEGWKENIQE